MSQGTKLTAIEPQALYPESTLRQLLESQTLRKAKRNGLPAHRFGRQSWILGADLIEHIRRHERGSDG